MSNFISYITQFSHEPHGAVLQTYTRKQEDDNHLIQTFKSYLEDEGPEDMSNDEVEGSASEFFDMELKPDTLPGESIIGEADSVLKYTPFCDGKQGMSGKLCATNFKISFVTADRSSYDMGKRQRNQLLNENDIPLTAIEAIYFYDSKGKKKRLFPGTTTSSHIKLLEIHCKDFQIHTFSFKFTSKQQSKQFTNVIGHHSFATKETLLYAYTFGQHSKGKAATSWVCDTPMYDTRAEWQEELVRCHADSKWRVTDINETYEMSTSMPKYFAVPASLHNNDLTKSAAQFTNRRILTWCYSHITRNSLSRMSCVDVDRAHQDVEKKMLDAVKVAGDTKNSPKLINIGENCPSCRDVQESFSRLKKMCLINTKKDFWVQDMNWFSALEETKWLQLVRQCLSTSCDIADQLHNKFRSIVIQESSGYDLTCLISSLVMLILDPHFRTQLGFQSVIQREWVKMGHPFQKYLGLVIEPDTEQVPIFLLFLDCVWQLLKQFPGSFEFTETYLTTLWDTAHVGLFDTFLFNNDHQRSLYAYKDSHNIKKIVIKLPPVWAWQLQFASEDLSFFNDPLYVLTHDQQLTGSMSDTRQLLKPGQVSQTLRHSLYSRKLTNMYTVEQEDKQKALGVLTPNPSAPMIHLWTQCYLRWQAPAQILSGGTPSQYLQQCHMVEEILHLHHKAAVMEEQRDHKRPQSKLIFSYGSQKQARSMPQTANLLNSTYLTSSFPFTPGPASKEQQMNYMTTLSMYLQNSTLDFDTLELSED